ncbi:matrin-3-like isoform X2 [Denticeps clupeoides]|uniref:matrin-3-like isoform X2 n=1 Tax=Denticeps clupeoides TaxID=299321 RepID=UPI0010A32A6F|nr:matrin-3-like isoform X2 [Denticeps clupeoides]
MSGDSAEKGFAVGRGLLAAAETLNFNMGDSSADSLFGSSPSMSGMARGPGMGQADHDPQIPRRVGSHLSNTLKLFASLGLSPSDLDVLAQIPEENISVDTLPDLIMQLKNNRKVEASQRMAGNRSGASFRDGVENWGDMHGGQHSTSMSQASGRGSGGDFGYRSMQDVPSRSYGQIDYDNHGSGGGRDRSFSDLSHDTYHGLSMGSSSSADSMFTQRRTGSPSQSKLQDYFGLMPYMFPHVCSLCDFDVHSAMEWTQHTNGLCHSEKRRLLLEMYPDWDPQISSSQRSGALSQGSTNRRDGLLGDGPQDNRMQRGGMSSSWGSTSGFLSKPQQLSATPKIRSRVVVIKYDRKPLSSNSLFALAKPFGTICENLVLKNKAFLELRTHEEALAMANFYQRKPAILHGKEVHVYLSKELLVIEKVHQKDSRGQARGKRSQVVFFSNLPRDVDIAKDLLTAAQRFGIVEKHLVFKKEAFIQMGSPEDAEMLVKYHTMKNPLNIKGKTLRLNICTKYKTLVVNPLMGGQDTGRRDGSKTNYKGHKGKEGPSKDVADEEEEVGAHVVESWQEEPSVMEADQNEEDVKEEQMTLTTDLEHPEPEDKTDERECEETVAETEGGGDEAQDDDPRTEEGGDEAENTAQPELSEPTEAVKDEEEEEETDPSPQTEGDKGPEEDADEESGEPDLPENMDDFVTLDELAEVEESDSGSRAQDSSESSEKSGGLRVVNVSGFERGHGFFDKILSLAKPFGTVVRHLLLNVRPEAFLELSSEEEAKKMVSFYNSNVTPSICGKPVKIFHSHTYATIQSRSVVYVSRFPYDASDFDVLKIAEPFGKIRRYLLNRSRNECFIEMERGEDAERMAEAYKTTPMKFQGKWVTVYLSRKYKHLRYGHRPPFPKAEEKKTPKRDRTEIEETATSLSPTKCIMDEGPPVKKIKEEKNAEQTGLVDTVQDKEADVPTINHENKNGEEPADSKATSSEEKTSEVISLGTHEPNVPVGTEFVKAGYYCRVCFLFYSNEHTAKVVHCSSKAHFEKLKKHLEKEKAKARLNDGSN